MEKRFFILECESKLDTSQMHLQVTISNNDSQKLDIHGCFIASVLVDLMEKLGMVNFRLNGQKVGPQNSKSKAYGKSYGKKRV